MKVIKIYRSIDSGNSEYIYCLKNGRKIIKRSDSKTRKLNVNKWEEINYIPDNFVGREKEITDSEKKDLKSFIKKGKVKKTIFTILKNKIINFFR